MANLIGFNLDLKPESREVVMQFIHLHLLSWSIIY
jgi:hypothetical protein